MDGMKTVAMGNCTSIIGRRLRSGPTPPGEAAARGRARPAGRCPGPRDPDASLAVGMRGTPPQGQSGRNGQGLVRDAGCSWPVGCWAASLQLQGGRTALLRSGVASGEQNIDDWNQGPCRGRADSVNLRAGCSPQVDLDAEAGRCTQYRPPSSPASGSGLAGLLPAPSDSGRSCAGARVRATESSLCAASPLPGAPQRITRAPAPLPTTCPWRQSQSSPGGRPSGGSPPGSGSVRLRRTRPPLRSAGRARRRH